MEGKSSGLQKPNMKIKNATPMEYDGINFKSKLEVMTYKTLVENGFTPKYEAVTYVIWDGFIPTIPFLTKDKFKRKNHNIVSVGTWTVNDKRGQKSITYTPDFTFSYNGKNIIIEAKGMENDVFGYKFKIFRKYLEELPDKDTYEVWEVFSKRQLLECIEHLKNEGTEGH